jgi:hypothetical protein
MTNIINNSENFYPIHLELLEALLEPEDATYPWNPIASESQEYFHEAQTVGAIDELLDSELSARSQSFYNRLDSLWSNNYNHTTNVGIVASLKENLQAALAAVSRGPSIASSTSLKGIGERIPHEWIERIAQKATDIFNPKQSLSEQFMLCAQELLPSLGTDDLSVLGRPFVYAMRNNEPHSLESVLNKVGEHEWKNLSEIEQAKVSMAVAYYALQQLKNEAEP